LLTRSFKKVKFAHHFFYFFLEKFHLEHGREKKKNELIRSLYLVVLSARPVSGASMNPARSIGPALISGEYRALWVYIVGPIVGAVAGAWAYNLIRFTNKPLREITKSTSFLKSMSRMNSSA
jgi:glycerol uptake facilitator-like aquaporin